MFLISILRKTSSSAAPRAEIEIREASAPKAKNWKSGNRLRNKGFGSHYGVNILSAHLDGGPRAAGTVLTDDGGTGLREEDWGSHGGRLGEIEYFNRFERLFFHLQGLLASPPMLFEQSLIDTVNVRLTFREGSRCDWRRSRLGGSNPKYQKFIKELLVRVCEMEFIATSGFTPGQFVDLSFHFGIQIVTDRTDENPPPIDFIQGNVLAFRRNLIRIKGRQGELGHIVNFLEIPLPESKRLK